MPALKDGPGMHLLQNITNEDGHAAWNEISDWYGSDITSWTIIDHYRKKLESLRLVSSTEASDYVNTFKICFQKLEARQEGYTVATKR